MVGIWEGGRDISIIVVVVITHAHACASFNHALRSGGSRGYEWLMEE